MFAVGAPRTPLREGVKITIRNVEVTIPPWNISTARAGCDARRVLREAAARNDNDTDEALAATAKLAGLSLRMNYPEVRDEMLEDELTLVEMRRIIEVVSEVNAGEARAPAMTGAKVRELTTSDATGTNLQ